MQNEDREWEQRNEQEPLRQSGDDADAGAAAPQVESEGGGDDPGDFDANPPIIISG